MKICTQECIGFRIHTIKDSCYLADPMLKTADKDKILYSDANTDIRQLAGRSPPGMVLQQRYWRRNSRLQSRGSSDWSRILEGRSNYIQGVSRL
jgi:hypothetical protein